MAAVDTTQFARYCTIFPELTAVQSETCILLSMGLSLKTVAAIRGVSQQTVKETLNAIRMRLELNSALDVRIATNVRLTLAMMDKLT